MNPDPLEIALDAQRPIDDAPRLPLAVELLLSELQRVTVEDPQAFRESIKPKPAAEPIDELVAELTELKPEGGI